MLLGSGHRVNRKIKRESTKQPNSKFEPKKSLATFLECSLVNMHTADIQPHASLKHEVTETLLEQCRSTSSPLWFRKTRKQCRGSLIARHSSNVAYKCRDGHRRGPAGGPRAVAIAFANITGSKRVLDLDSSDVCSSPHRSYSGLFFRHNSSSCR